MEFGRTRTRVDTDMRVQKHVRIGHGLVSVQMSNKKVFTFGTFWRKVSFLITADLSNPFVFECWTPAAQRFCTIETNSTCLNRPKNNLSKSVGHLISNEHMNHLLIKLVVRNSLFSIPFIIGFKCTDFFPSSTSN